MRFPLIFLLLAGTAMPLYAQAVGAAPQRQHFVEGAFSAEYVDTLGPAFEHLGGGGEVGVQVWQGESRNGRTPTGSVRFRVEAIGDLYLLSFLYASERMFTRRIGFELPIGVTAMTEKAPTAPTVTSMGVSVGGGIPIVVTDRFAVVPRVTGLLVFESGVAGMMDVVGLGVRWRF